jgi:phosphoribosylanthranilate isomerase
MRDVPANLFAPLGLGDSASPWVKICGVTRLEDARLALELGADLLGINLWRRSRRYLPPPAALKLLSALPPTARILAVVVLDETFGPREVAGLPVTGFQVHGARSEADLPDLDKPLLVAVSPSEVDLFPDRPVIVDGSWGSGRRADWELLRGLGRPYCLSGGLDPSNVAEAIRFLAPAGVDACSGVELAPGIKDAARLHAFMAAVAQGRELLATGRQAAETPDRRRVRPERRGGEEQ